ncbi:TetR/AcrR family transcriptional regulator [Arthrobacter sp. 35W]|uniref:TetR/AcrR family transcriptional regulator n=1 Tax=Arthrobacter sp. 35W TaxID=1132441 RepID=UPI0004071FA5|nr:TetR/AcrR family transcriptional regulator [Arthrobacter sp. 35W]
MNTLDPLPRPAATASGTAPADAGTAPSADSAAPAAVDGRSARWEAHRGERRRELIRAARRAVHELGPDASMEDIATAAGTSKSVFYRYFGDKAGLQQAVGELAITLMQQKVLAAAQAAATPRQGLCNMVSAYLQMAQTSPNVYAFATTGHPSAAGPLGHFFDEVVAMMADTIRTHARGAGSPLLAYWPTAALGLVRNAGELWLMAPASPGKPDHGELAEQLTTWLFSGIAADVGPQAT